MLAAPRWWATTETGNLCLQKIGSIRLGACPPATCLEGVDAMGRGRAKAKQTKVARELKYHAPETDLERLARELHGEVDSDTGSGDEDDPYAEGNWRPRA